MSYSVQPTRSKIRSKINDGNALLILSWGSVAWYRSFPMEMTVDEVHHYLARELGRLNDGVVIGLKLLITGTDLSPTPLTPLRDLTYPPYRNVCLDVADNAPASQRSTIHSLGEHLLRKHLCNEHFQAGVAQRLWRLIQLRWPHAVFGLSTRFGNSEIAVRLNLEKYPASPPLVEFWNLKTQTILEPLNWPVHLIQFAITSYPELADICAESYSPELLHISIEIARRRKNATSLSWDVTKDLTQTLRQASRCFWSLEHKAGGQ